MIYSIVLSCSAYGCFLFNHFYKNTYCRAAELAAHAQEGKSVLPRKLQPVKEEPVVVSTSSSSTSVTENSSGRSSPVSVRGHTMDGEEGNILLSPRHVKNRLESPSGSDAGSHTSTASRPRRSTRILKKESEPRKSPRIKNKLDSTVKDDPVDGNSAKTNNMSTSETLQNADKKLFSKSVSQQLQPPKINSDITLNTERVLRKRKLSASSCESVTTEKKKGRPSPKNVETMKTENGAIRRQSRKKHIENVSAETDSSSFDKGDTRMRKDELHPLAATEQDPMDTKVTTADDNVHANRKNISKTAEENQSDREPDNADNTGDSSQQSLLADNAGNDTTDLNKSVDGTQTSKHAISDAKEPNKNIPESKSSTETSESSDPLRGMPVIEVTSVGHDSSRITEHPAASSTSGDLSLADKPVISSTKCDHSQDRKSESVKCLSDISGKLKMLIDVITQIGKSKQLNLLYVT